MIFSLTYTIYDVQGVEDYSWRLESIMSANYPYDIVRQCQ